MAAAILVAVVRGPAQAVAQPVAAVPAKAVATVVEAGVREAAQAFARTRTLMGDEVEYE